MVKEKNLKNKNIEIKNNEDNELMNYLIKLGIGFLLILGLSVSFYLNYPNVRASSVFGGGRGEEGIIDQLKPLVMYGQNKNIKLPYEKDFYGFRVSTVKDGDLNIFNIENENKEEIANRKVCYKTLNFIRNKTENIDKVFVYGNEISKNKLLSKNFSDECDGEHNNKNIIRLVFKPQK